MKTLPVFLCGRLLVCAAVAGGQAPPSFVNFETAPVHPVALSPNGRTLAVCNLPDGRLELFDVSSGVPAPLGDVPVGMDPVSVRFRTTNEVWVVNHISSSVSVVDVARRRVVATLATRAGPADVAFAGAPLRAFVSCAKADAVQVFDPVTRAVVTNLAINGDRPKALAVSPDGTKVFVAIFESGNGSTILAPALTTVDVPPAPGVVEDARGPYRGQNPPPNSGSAFSPTMNPAIPTNQPAPRVSHIVKKNASGKWADDNNKDWSQFVSGNRAAVSGRIAGWDLPDRDLAMINASTFAVTYFSGLMNICMDVAVNPVSQRVTVIGTDATNERRFEPNLRSTFLRVNFASVNTANGSKTLKDLNAHLNYQTRSLPQAQRDKALGDPRGVVWNSAGTRAYVTGMGSRNLVVLDGNGDRARPEPIELGEGPTGLALDEARQRLYVLNRFSATLSVVNTASETVVTNVPLFDPTPDVIKRGRPRLYDTRGHSGLGHVACASCHVDARMDRLAWDLGDPSGDLLTRSNLVIIGGEAGSPTFSWFTFHPMKGPMVTQTFQDFIGHEPFHWRGDRSGLEEFNQTFPNLLGRDTTLTAPQMQEFKDFLATIHFPPSLTRNFDDTLSTNVSLAAEGLPSGNAVRGRELANQILVFGSAEFTCRSCHVPPTGLSPKFLEATLGIRGDSHLGLIRLGRQDGLPFKGPQLRNLADKLGLRLDTAESRAGFGFMHDGRVDTLGNFLRQGFDLEGPDQVDVLAFMLSLSGSDPLDLVNPPSVPSRDVAASVGKQITLTESNGLALAPLLAVAESPSNRADLVARGARDGVIRGWYYDRVMDVFQSDRHGEVMSAAALLALATPTNELTFTVVARGTGRRLGVDRDEDGHFDRSEIDASYDPQNPAAHAANRPPQLTPPPARAAYPGQPFSLAMQASDPDSPAQTLTFRRGASAPPGASIHPTSGVFTWTPPPVPTATTYRIGIQATDDGSPPLSDEKELVLVVNDYGPVTVSGVEISPFITTVNFRAIPGKHYRLQYKNRLDDPAWTDGETLMANSPDWSLRDFGAFLSTQRFYRIVLLD